MNLDQIFSSLKTDYNEYLPKRHRKALKELKKDTSISISKADKGSKIVVMDRDQYTSKIRNLLAYKNVYKKLKRTPYKQCSKTLIKD